MRINSNNKRVVRSFNLTLPEWVAIAVGLLWSGGLVAFEAITLVGIKDNKRLGSLKPFPEFVLA